MSLSVWSANTKISGGALIAKVNFDNSLIISFFKQIANNPDKKNNFDFKNSINIKFNEDEIGDMIRAIRTNSEFKFYHSFKDIKTSGNLSFYSIAATEANKAPRTGFGFSVLQGEKTTKVGLSTGCAEKLLEYLRFVLSLSFEAGFNEDLAKEKEYRDKNKNKPTAPSKVQSNPTQETPTENDFGAGNDEF